ncbi:MAG: hypothetical protein AAGB48_00295 [Planctomycetota bacterium]
MPAPTPPIEAVLTSPYEQTWRDAEGLALTVTITKIRIEFDTESNGFLQLGISEAGSVVWDNWFLSWTDALEASQEDFGLSLDDWYGVVQD